MRPRSLACNLPLHLRHLSLLATHNGCGISKYFQCVQFLSLGITKLEKACIHSSGLVKNPKFLIYLSTEPTNIWKDTEMLDWVHIWSKTHIHSLPHLKHTQQLSQTHFHTLLTRYLLGHKKSRCTCQFRFCKGNRDVWFRCLFCLWNCGTIT